MKENEVFSKETGEKLLAKANKLYEKEGMNGWNLAQETMLSEQTSSPELKEAIEYVMLKYPPDYFRPALLSLCSKSVGGTPEITISTAATLVLLGRAIGIHDDIIDQSKTKNQNPTIYGKFGKDLALVLSNVLLFKGFTIMKKTIQSGIATKRVIATLSTIERIWFEQSEGEVLELRSRRRIDITPGECLAKIRMRASELEAITRIGGILGGGSPDKVNILGEFGRLLGTMSLLRNEIIDMLEFDILRHRIRKESLPLPLIYAIQDSQIGLKIISIVSKKRLKRRDLQRISQASDEAGGLSYVAGIIIKLAKEAYSLVDLLKSEKKELKLLVSSITLNSKDWKPVLQTSVPSAKMASTEL